MRIVKAVSDFPANASIKTGFVPTLGALHEGHLSLIRRSKAENDRTVVSIFVNPTQFGPNEDFTKYPRPFERDCELANSAGADIIFAPDSNNIYTEHSTSIHVPYVTDLFEGEIRPQHFDGVATIVAKLFNIVSPNHAYFGEKDLQQCAVVSKLIADLNLNVKLIICPTLREENGLAMSSRNAYLSEEERDIAASLFVALNTSRDEILSGVPVQESLAKATKGLTAKSFKVDYLELVDRTTMHPISVTNEHASLIIAAKLGTTRLIDNVRVVG